METLWVAIIASASGLIGVIVGGLLNYFISSSQFKREKEWKTKLIIKDKLEEIATTAEELNYEFKKYMGGIIMYVTYNKKLNIGDKPPIPTAKLNMLIKFYNPDLINYLDSLNAEMSANGKILAKALSDKWDSGKKVLVPKLLLGQTKIEKACKDLVEATAKSARKQLA